MYDKASVAVMAVCPNQSLKIPAALETCFWQMESGNEAFEIMRLLQIDLLLVSTDLSDIDVWQFIKKVKMRDSHAKWVLLSNQIDPEQEIQARTLGVLRIFYTMPDIYELYEMAVFITQNRKLQSFCHSNCSLKVNRDFNSKLSLLQRSGLASDQDKPTGV